MTMPIIPALAGGAAAEPATLADLLASLAPEEVDALVDAAAAWSDAGEAMPIDFETGAGMVSGEPEGDDEAAEGEGDEPVEHVEDLEAEAAEDPEQQAEEAAAGAEDFDALLSQVAEKVEKARGFREELDEVLELAKEAEEVGGDPDAVEDLIEDADKLIAEIEDLAADAEESGADEDANGIAQAGLQVDEKCELLRTLVEQSRVHAAQNSPEDGAVDPATGEADEMPALSLWAQRYEP